MFYAKVLSLVVLCVALAQARVVPQRVENLAHLSQLRPEELSGQFEGDILLTAAQERALLSGSRNGMIALTYRWPRAAIPVMIVEEDFTPEQVDLIRQALHEIQAATCLRFVEYESLHANFVRVIGSESGCYAYVGRIGGGQELNLGPGCHYVSTIIHEFIHAIGFWHQQSATNRDDYVDIIWENIDEGMEHNFNIYDATFITDFGVPYDYDSVMHYGPTAFSRNGEPTIVPKDPTANIGQRDGMSERDIEKINLMYNCPPRPFKEN